MNTINSNIPTELSLAQPLNATGNNNLDQRSFLRLMTTQLQSQDPFKPLDNQAMVAQMAQFSQVSGIAEMNQSLKDIAASLTSNRLSDSAGWIGHKILVPGHFVVADENGKYSGEFTLDEPAENISIDLLNRSGEIVHYVELGAQEAGPMNFSFDARNATGIGSDLGRLRVRVNGGKASDLATWVPVASITSPSKGAAAKLVTPIGNFAPSEALRLS